MTTDRNAVRRSTPTASDAFTSESSWGTLQLACDAAELDSDGAELLRLGTNANYRLAHAPIMVRIARGRADDVRKEVAVARWLASHEFPAARVIEDIAQPMAVDGRLVTFWEFIDGDGVSARSVEIAGLLRDLHNLPAPESVDLPPFVPLEHTVQRLDDTPDGPDARFLRERCRELQHEFAALEFSLTPGVIHGDAHDRNAVRDSRGAVRLIDFESFCCGPREWDIGVLALRYRPFGWISEDEYRACVTAYGGYDVTAWPGYAVLQGIRELDMTSWLFQNIGESPKHEAEFRKRMIDLRDQSAPRDWQAF